jgi:SAM-dependent methyltransferase
MSENNMNTVRQKFDGYAEQYDKWFMENSNLFESELRLFKKALGDISGKRLLSVGCGSGLFESYIDCSQVEGIEPSRDMGEIAKKRGVNVICFGLIEDVELPENSYDIIYFNGSSSYMEDLASVYRKSIAALKDGGKLILLDVPKESAFGFMYLLGKSLGTYEHEYLEGTMPQLPYPLALAASGVWHSTEEKIDVLKKLGITKFSFYQTLVRNPMYTNEEPEEVSDGYKSGGYVAIIAEK